ncbi:MAG: PKD domain-containing protein [Bacteroidales bacterium]|nr:PKD domain-containing protein [Bacteroidales bacterium]
MKKVNIIIILLFIVLSVHAQAPKVQINGIPFNNNQVDYYHLTAQTGSRLKITVNFLTLGQDVDLIVRNIAQYGGTIIYNSRQTVSSSGRISTILPSNNNLGVDISNGLNGNSGFFEIEVREHNGSLTGNLIVNFSYHNHSNNFDSYLVIEKQKQFSITGVPYNFIIHYADNFFNNHPLGISSNIFTGYVENAFRDSWTKEVDEWELCKGISRTNNQGTITNIPFDQDGDYHIFIHSNYQAPSLTFYFGSDIYAVGNDGDRAIYIDSRSIDYVKSLSSIQNNHLTENELIYQIISHEFLHGIQWSHMSWNNIVANFPNSQTELNNRLWLIEGQAKSLETIFMNEGNFSTINANTAFAINTYKYSYEYYTAGFLNDAIGSNYNFKSHHDIKYDYAMFWRHLYEHNLDKTNNTITNKDKLAIFRETCKAYEQNNSSNFGKIETFMSNELLNVNGNFKTYDEALSNFTEKAYFHDNRWKKDGHLVNNWDDPNTNNFYTSILANPSNPAFTEPIAISCNQSTSFPQIFPSTDTDIDKSFAFRAHKVETNNINYQTKSLYFNADPDGDNIMADFKVQFHTFNTTTNEITSSKEIETVNGVGQKNICHAVGEDFVVLVTRVDGNEGVIPGNYEIKWDNAIQANLNFNAKQSIFDLKLIKFRNLSTGATGDWLWDFGDGISSTIENTGHEYTKSGSFNVSLKHIDCTEQTFVKNNYINILPAYIESVGISQNSEVIPSVEFEREYNKSSNTWSFEETNNFEVLEATTLNIDVKTSLPLKSLNIEVFNGNALVYTTTLSSEEIAKKTNWTFLIPSEKITAGLYKLKFSGKDFADIPIIKEKDPVLSKLFIDESQVGWDYDVDVKPLLGTDNNYIFLVDGDVGENPEDYLDVVIENNCGDNIEITVSNNSDKWHVITIDGVQYTGIPQHSYKTYQITSSGKAIKIIISLQVEVNGSWTHIPVLTRIVGFSD